MWTETHVYKLSGLRFMNWNNFGEILPNTILVVYLYFMLIIFELILLNTGKDSSWPGEYLCLAAYSTDPFPLNPVNL